MRLPNPRALVSVLSLAVSAVALAQSPSQRNPDVSNKALITKSTPGINPDAFKNQSVSTAIATLHKLADDYYAWRNENYPVRSSEAGLHTWDDRLTDYSPAKIAERAQHVRSLLDKVRAMKTDNWPKDERIDWILFRAQLENVEFGDRVLKFESHESADLRGRMHQRHFLAAKEGIRHTAETRARGHCASQADASAVEARPEQFAEAGKTLCAARDSIRPLDRSAFQQKPDGAGRGSLA